MQSSRSNKNLYKYYLQYNPPWPINSHPPTEIHSRLHFQSEELLTRYKNFQIRKVVLKIKSDHLNLSYSSSLPRCQSLLNEATNDSYLGNWSETPSQHLNKRKRRQDMQMTGGLVEVSVSTKSPTEAT